MNFRTLDLNLLRVFDALMAEGSLTRAAQMLSTTQPAVSHALKRLHEAVGEPLFERAARGMRPTSRAEALWPVVREALASLRHALAPAGFDPALEPVNFRLAMVDATAVLLMPPLVRSLEAQRAQANLRVLPLSTRDPRGLLERAEVDLAVGHFPEALAAISAQGEAGSLRHHRLWDTHYVCVMRAGHPLAGKPLSLDDYCEAHHLLVSFSGRPHGFVDQALAALGRRRRVVLTVNQFNTAGRIVMASDLLTVLPQSFLAATGHPKELHQQPFPFEIAGVQVEMIWHRRFDADPAHHWLREQVVASRSQVVDHLV